MSKEDKEFARKVTKTLADSSMNRRLDTQALKETKTGQWVSDRYFEWPIRIDKQGRALVWDDGRPLMGAIPILPSTGGVAVIERANILFLSTSIDNDDLSRDLADGAHRDPTSRSYPLYLACRTYQLIESEIQTCIQLSKFWQSFFGSDTFLDEPLISKPAAMVATGAMRNYHWDDGETVDVRERLTEIAKLWGVPLIFLKGFTHGFTDDTQHGHSFHRDNPLNRIKDMEF